MYVRMMLTVQQLCYVPKQMVLAQKSKSRMFKKNTFVILMVLAYISIIMIQLIVMRTKLVQQISILKTVKLAILQSDL
ncbi:Uncharacterised protein [Acinetobacter baumannii]|nr:Uncharacterised protein [Acinetobacter baumannii]